MSTLIQSLADYLINLKYDDLPPQAIETAKQVILDAYGNIICSRFSDRTEQVMHYASLISDSYKAGRSVPIIGEATMQFSVDAALFAYAVMGRMADMDDGYSHAMGHPGSFLVPVLLVVAPMYQRTGCEVITAIIAAYDIYARIGEAINPSMHRDRGFDATGVCGAVAAAALIAKLSGFNIARTVHAMGLAAIFSGGLIECQNDGTSGKYLCGAWAVMNGLRAVRLAECGFTGPSKALEGKSGLFQGFQGTSGYDASHVLDNLGRDYKINSIYFKRYACLRGLHATMDAILSLKEKHGLTPDNVRVIDVRASRFLLRLSNLEPKTVISAQGSIQFAAAVMLKYSRLDSEEFLLDCLNDLEIQTLMARVSVTEDQDMQAYLEAHPSHFSASKVIILTADGKRLEEFRALPDGEAAEHRFGWEMLESKFKHLVRDTPLSEESSARIAFIKELETQADISPLCRVKS